MKLNLFALPDPAKLADKQLREARLQLMQVEAALEQHAASKAALVERIKRLEGYQPMRTTVYSKPVVVGNAMATVTHEPPPMPEAKPVRRTRKAAA